MEDTIFIRSSVFPLVACSACIFLALISSPTAEDECADSITIESVQYVLPDRWCGKTIDTAKYANVDLLVRLPDELAYEGFRIYVTRETRAAVVGMTAAARESDINLITDSGFRSVAFQKSIIRRRIEAGETYEQVINFVAPPGYSEHHTGQAVDFVPSEYRFAYTDEFKWLRENAYRFGFYETYPEDTTGQIPWESWHWTFVPDSVSQ